MCIYKKEHQVHITNRVYIHFYIYIHTKIKLSLIIENAVKNSNKKRECSKTEESFNDIYTFIYIYLVNTCCCYTLFSCAAGELRIESTLNSDVTFARGSEDLGRPAVQYIKTFFLMLRKKKNNNNNNNNNKNKQKRIRSTIFI
jgi:hypothetical protein